MTVEQVAKRFGRGDAYVRELLSRMDRPAFRGGKYWVIPQAILFEWQTPSNGLALDEHSSLTLPSACDPGRASPHPKAPRPYTTEVRRPRRSTSGDGQEMGDGRARHEEHD